MVFEEKVTLSPNLLALIEESLGHMIVPIALLAAFHSTPQETARARHCTIIELLNLHAAA